MPSIGKEGFDVVSALSFHLPFAEIRKDKMLSTACSTGENMNHMRLWTRLESWKKDNGKLLLCHSTKQNGWVRVPGGVSTQIKGDCIYLLVFLEAASWVKNVLPHFTVVFFNNRYNLWPSKFLSGDIFLLSMRIGEFVWEYPGLDHMPFSNPG